MNENKNYENKNLSQSQIKLKAFLEGLYYAYSRRELIYPDPLDFLYKYTRENLEVVGLIASSLAYGRVSQILKSVECVLSKLGDNPRDFILKNNLRGILDGFKHRFTTAADMENLLINTAKILNEYGTVEKFFKFCLDNAQTARLSAQCASTLRTLNVEILNALDTFSDILSVNNDFDEGLLSSFPLIPAPRDGSACKRLFLFLKWLVRHDDVDPGGWSVIKPKDLIMPTDTHIHAAAMRLGLSRRKQADLKSALEITGSLAALNPDDPTKYDFVLTRFGIRDGLSMDSLSDLSGIKY